MNTSQHESLRDIALIAQERHDGVGGREMARIAEKAGKVISFTTFDRIANGTYRSRPQSKTLDALAYLAGVSEGRVYKAAGRAYHATKFVDELPDEIDELTSDQRESLIRTARAFLKQNDEMKRLENELQKRQDSTEPSNVVEGDFNTEDAVPEQKIAAYDRELGDGIQPGDLPEDA